MCHSYWRLKHTLLLDTIDHLGFPSLFVTTNANEWRMNKSSWYQEQHNIHHFQPTGNVFTKTIQIIHSLQQIIIGYLTGSNHHNCKQHIFVNHKHKGRSKHFNLFLQDGIQKKMNVPHIHTLLWITQIHSINTKAMTADIPIHDPELAHYAAYMQSSQLLRQIHQQHTI